MEFYTVQQIAKQRGVSERAVYQQISNHKEELKGLTRKQGRKVWYSEEAVEILNQYVLKNVTVVEGVQETSADTLELQNKIDELEAIIKTLTENQATMLKMIQEKEVQVEQFRQLADKATLYLEDKATAEAKLTEAEQKLKDQESQINELSNVAADVRKELESYHKTIFGLYRKK